jgi:hypothetical protein
MAQAYVASFPFKYMGNILLKQQVLRKLGMSPNDGKLIGIRYLVPVGSEELKHAIKCDGCGREFLNIRAKDNHVKEKLCTQDSTKLSEAKRSDHDVISSLPDDLREKLEK